MAGQVGIPFINGKRPAWAQMRVIVLGRTLTGIVAVNYKRKRVKANQYGAGDQPDHRGYGNKEPECSLTLYKYEVDALNALAGPGRNITDLAPFDVIIQWREENQTIIQQVIIKDYEFTEDGLDTKQGDTKLEVPVGGICSAII